MMAGQYIQDGRVITLDGEDVCACSSRDMASKIARVLNSHDELVRHHRLLLEAVGRYMDLCRNGIEPGVCWCGDHDDNCPFEDRPCIEDEGGLCQWCQLDAAESGVDYRDIDKAALTKARGRERNNAGGTC